MKKYANKFHFFFHTLKKERRKYMFIKLIDRNQFVNLDTFDSIHMEYEKDGMFGNGEYIIKAKRLGVPSEEIDNSIEKEKIKIKDYEFVIRIYQESEKERAKEFYDEITESWALQVPIFPVETMYDTQEDTYKDFTETALCVLEDNLYPEDYSYETDNDLESLPSNVTLSPQDIEELLSALRETESLEKTTDSKTKGGNNNA